MALSSRQPPRTDSRSTADIVLVALGTPTQERLILENWRPVEAPVLLGVGALFNSLSHEQRRAPLWMRHSNLEWFFRLCTEPRRFFYRCAIESAALLRIVLDRGALEDIRRRDEFLG